MVAAYGETEATHDIDAVPLKSKRSFDELKPYFQKVAKELDLSKDWINPFFATFTHVLPADYLSRTREFFHGKQMVCVALGPEDLLIMKLMAGRQKDDRHIRRLLKRKNFRHSLVEQQLEDLSQKNLAGAKAALDRLDEFKSDLGVE